jgi:hypothetical protein
MENSIRNFIDQQLELGAMAVHSELAVVPLLCRQPGGPDYITLKEAFASGGFAVTEISESGSVPNLKVVNSTGRNVLLLDGEELAGAKQNRVLNTSILIAAGGSAIIPVSCTEQGRWNYASREFSDSGVMMSRSIRTNKSASVSESVRASCSYNSDQSGIWRDIEALHQSHGTSSHTGAMKDAYESRREQTESYKGHFPCQEGQCGMAVLIKGRVAGIEFLSRPDAYHQLHEKLLGSYIMDIPMAQAGKSGPDLIKIQKILERIKEGTEERFASVGLGEDCRYTIRGLVGSALLVDNWYLHGAFFRANRRDQTDSSSQERMSSMRQRRAYRQ